MECELCQCTSEWYYFALIFLNRICSMTLSYENFFIYVMYQNDYVS